MTPPTGGVVLCGRAIRWLAAALLAGCAAPPPPPTPVPADDLVAIPAVQGPGAQSPLQGRDVRVQGVVTASLRGLGGFLLQDPRGDGDPRTADALFVAWEQPLSMPAPGTLLRARGRVDEPDGGQGMTRLLGAELEPLGTAALPPAVELAAAPADWEALEGMRVMVEAPLTVTGNHGLWRFGELLAAFGGRLQQPTDLHPPGPRARAEAAAQAARLLLLDDARLRQHAPRQWQLPQPLTAEAPLRAGSRILGVEAIVDQRFGRYRLQPLRPFAAVEQAARPSAPRVPGERRLAVANVLNYFNGDGQGGGFPTARGAGSAAEFARQQDKLVAALAAMDADILALLEIENDGSGPDSSLASLVRALEAAAPGSRWQAVAPPAPGTDAIQVGLLYRADRVRTLGPAAQLATGPFAYGSRPPLLQGFDLGDGVPLLVAVNHFKSKGGCDAATGADADQGDGQGCFNAARVAAAAALADWVGGDPTGTGSPRVLLVGDFNAYTAEDPLRLLRGRGYVDLLAGSQAHSYVFDGRAGRLDHVLASPAAAAQVAGAAVWHANADESDAFDYNLEHRVPLDRYRPDPFRSSDHDPVLVGLRAGAR